jgi:hypothetical protein
MPTPTASLLQRRHLDLGADYLLRSVAILGSLFGGDVSRGLIYLTAFQASSQHLRNTQNPGRTQSADDEQRRPVSLSSIARSLSMSVETTRRQVLRLERDGFVDRAANGGVMVRLSGPNSEALHEALAGNSVNIQRLGGALQRLRAETAGPGNLA